MERNDERRKIASPWSSLKAETVPLWLLYLWLYSFKQASTAFTVSPQDTQVPVGWQATLRCNTGEETAKGQQYWFRYLDQNNGVILTSGKDLKSADSDHYLLVTDSSGLYNLIIKESLPEDAGIYRCGVACDLDGGGMSNGLYREAQLSIISPGNESLQCFISPSSEIEEGQSASLVCLSNISNVTLEWYSENQLLPSTHLDTPSSLTVHQLEPLVSSDSGRQFSCSSACEVGLLVTRTPLVRIQPPAVEVAIEADAEFSCLAEDGYPEEYTYTWFYNDGVIQEETNNYRFNNFVLKNDGKKLIIPDVNLGDDSAQIICQVENRAGFTAGAATLNVRNATVTMEQIGPIIVGVAAGLILLMMVIWITWWCCRVKRLKGPSSRKSASSNSNRWSNGTSGFYMEERSAGYGPDSRNYGGDWNSDLPAIRVTSTEEDGMMREIGPNPSPDFPLYIMDTDALVMDDNGRRGIYVINPERLYNTDTQLSNIQENNSDSNDSSDLSTMTDQVEAETYNTRL